MDDDAVPARGWPEAAAAALGADAQAVGPGSVRTHSMPDLSSVHTNHVGPS